jgi:predicted AlkP superfamily pyrophosphatase or phosphodiesterase
MEKKYLPVIVCILILFVTTQWLTAKNQQHMPRLVVVFIVDQFAYHYIPKLKPYFQHGLKELFDKGIVYTNAYHPHAIPETTTGHHALSTGTLPKDHGAILNTWFDQAYQEITYGQDPSPDAAVFFNGSMGKSAALTMVDGFSDQFVLASKPNAQNKAFSLSLKSHPAISTANRLGKAIWLSNSGNFTSSKKYFNPQLPAWLTEFNNDHNLAKMKSVSWKTMYPLYDAAYKFNDTRNYDYAGYKFSFVNSPSLPVNQDPKNPFEFFVKTPQASATLFSLAKVCVDENFTKASDRMLVWVCLSNLDLLCHFFGPQSLEVIDLIYHLDQQIEDFMGFAKRRVGEKNCLFVLAADHGIAPIPEILNKQGFNMAKRIMAPALLEALNKHIETIYKIKDVAKRYEPTFFILNKEALASVTPETKKAIIDDIKRFLLKQDGIKRVWTADELKHTTFAFDQYENFYKNQLYNGRSGDIIIMPQPYCLICHYSTGTSHLSPYEYDTHVPLVLYQKGRFTKKTITKKVWVPQLPVTLASILNVSRPSASTFRILPGLEGIA